MIKEILCTINFFFLRVNRWEIVASSFVNYALLLWPNNIFFKLINRVTFPSCRFCSHSIRHFYIEFLHKSKYFLLTCWRVTVGFVPTCRTWELAAFSNMGCLLCDPRSSSFSVLIKTGSDTSIFEEALNRQSVMNRKEQTKTWKNIQLIEQIHLSSRTYYQSPLIRKLKHNNTCSAISDFSSLKACSASSILFSLEFVKILVLII